MGKEFTVTVANWQKYCRAVKDENSIHYDADRARRLYDLESIVAPGMFIASHVQGSDEVTGFQVTFKEKVYDGDELSMDVIENGYVFNRGNDRVCEIKRFRQGSFIAEVPGALVNSLHTYSAFFSERDILAFQESIEYTGRNALVGMYLSALSGPALLDYAKEEGIEGVHLAQSFNLHSLMKPGIVGVSIGGKREREIGGNLLYSFDMRWIDASNGHIVASGKAKVSPLIH